jgi:predicted component of type VI protein secretion system
MVFLETFLPSLHSKEESPLVTSIKYNLKQLLESEAPLILLEPDLVESGRSIFAYGIEDIQSLNYQVGKAVFTSRIKTLINHFEKRIENVEIELLIDNEKNNSIRFIISGDLVDGQVLQLDSRLNISDFSLSMENEVV